MNPENSIDELIQRLKNGQCTPEELELIRKWISQMNLGELIISSDELERIKKSMYQHVLREVHEGHVAPARRLMQIGKYAAVAGLIALVGLLSFWIYTSSVGDFPSGNTATASAVVLNSNHTMKKILMPDGTIIWLNRNSRLEFDARQYNHELRYVKLSGEGYFEVMKDIQRPFIVETGTLQTRVLGTAFNIEAYQHESEIRVSLVHGKVELESRDHATTTVLYPGQTLRFSKHTKETQVLPIAVNNIEQWREGGRLTVSMHFVKILLPEK